MLTLYAADILLYPSTSALLRRLGTSTLRPKVIDIMETHDFAPLGSAFSCWRVGSTVANFSAAHPSLFLFLLHCPIDFSHQKFSFAYLFIHLYILCRFDQIQPVLCSALASLVSSLRALSSLASSLRGLSSPFASPFLNFEKYFSRKSL